MTRRDPPGLPVLQERSRDTREQLLTAAESILRERGNADFTIAEVAGEAGYAVGSVYRRFANKDQLLDALVDRWVGEGAERARRMLHPSLWEGRSIGEILESYLRVATGTTRERGSLSRVLLALALQNPDLAARTDAVQSTIDRGLRRLLRERTPEIGHAEPETAITFVLEQLRAHLMARRFGEPIHQRSRLSDETFIRESLASACSYLRTPLPESR